MCDIIIKYHRRGELLMKGYMEHTEESIYRLSSVQFNIFGVWHKLIRILTALVLLWLGINMQSSTVVAALCLMAGAWMIASLNQLPKHKAKKLIDSADGKLPKSSYTFEERSIRIKSTGASGSITYDQIVRLVEDDDYFYLFINRNAAYMIAKKSAEPSAKELRKFIAEHTELQWTANSPLWRMSVRDIIGRVKSGRRKRK